MPARSRVKTPIYVVLRQCHPSIQRGYTADLQDGDFEASAIKHTVVDQDINYGWRGSFAERDESVELWTDPMAPMDRIWRSRP